MNRPLRSYEIEDEAKGPKENAEARENVRELMELRAQIWADIEAGRKLESMGAAEASTDETTKRDLKVLTREVVERKFDEKKDVLGVFKLICKILVINW